MVVNVPCSEPEHVLQFKGWLREHGGSIHPAVCFVEVPSGLSVIASDDIPEDVEIVTCPFDLAITPDFSRRALLEVLPSVTADALQGWTERQLICAYICMHWLYSVERSPRALQHWPYIRTLPVSSKLRTPLHFTDAEMEVLKGSNLYGATLDRQREWQTEWQQCQAAVASVNPDWQSEFTWERYLTAATYLSSRAFPSTLLSDAPSLINTPASYPVLLPGVDALNHARGQPVSWVVSTAESASTPTKSANISLIIRYRAPQGSELLNNYGPKPNSELILGYGFALPNNPDDTIVLKIGASGAAQPLPQAAFEVGRGAGGVEPVWQAVLRLVAEDPDALAAEDELYAAEMLSGMAENLLKRMPVNPRPVPGQVREDVAEMIGHYIEGQRDVLQSVIAFAGEKMTLASSSLELIDEEEEEGSD